LIARQVDNIGVPLRLGTGTVNASWRRGNIRNRDFAMPQLVAISREVHGTKTWRRLTSYSFAATDALLPVIGVEIARMALSMAIAFVQQSGRYLPVAIASLERGRNLFVGPDGQWLGRHVPVGLRSYPFRLAQREGSEDVFLCIDEDSGLVGNDGSAEDFFDPEGNPSSAIKGVMELLTEMERSRKATEIAMDALRDADVIRPWEIKMKTDREEKSVQGLNRIDEAAFNALSDDAFLELRRVSALPIAYAHFFSTDQLTMLPHMARVQGQFLQSRSANQTPLDRLLAQNPDGLIRFE
jgi:hypothetical protein